MIRWNRRDGMAELGKPAAIAAESAPVNGTFATVQSEKRGHKRNTAERSIRRAAPEMPLFGEPVALHPDAPEVVVAVRIDARVFPGREDSKQTR